MMVIFKRYFYKILTSLILKKVLPSHVECNLSIDYWTKIDVRWFDNRHAFVISAYFYNYVSKYILNNVCNRWSNQFLHVRMILKCLWWLDGFEYTLLYNIVLLSIERKGRVYVYVLLDQIGKRVLFLFQFYNGHVWLYDMINITQSDKHVRRKNR